MPAPVTTIPDDFLDLFAAPNLAHLAYQNDSGQLVSWPVWVDYDGTHLIVNSPVGSGKGRSMRARPQVALSIVSGQNPFHWISVSGRVVDVVPDEGLVAINRMSNKYVGGDYGRPGDREMFLIAIDRIATSAAWG